MRFALKVAWRFLKSNKGQTVLIALGIAIGVSVQVFIGSLITGLQKSLINKTIGNSSQITVLSDNDDKTIDAWQHKLEIVKANEKIEYASPSVEASAFLSYDNKSQPVLMRGFKFEEADKIYNIKSRIYEGQLPTESKEVLLGRDLVKELEVRIGDEVEITTPKGTKEKVKVSGFYDLKVASLNKSWIITDLTTVQHIFDLGDKITSIETQMGEEDIFSADVVASEIEISLKDSNLKVENWKVQNEQLLSGLKGQSVSSNMIQVFVLVAVVLGIASVLAISVLQKSKQIGILKAMGVKDRVASLIFLAQGFLLGIMGAVLGVLFGLGLSWIFTKFALNPDGTPVVELYIDYKFIAVSAFIALLSSTVAALVPARRSSKLNPIEVIKNG